MKEILLDVNLTLLRCSWTCENRKFFSLLKDGTLTLICPICGRQRFFVDGKETEEGQIVHEIKDGEKNE